MTPADEEARPGLPHDGPPGPDGGTRPTTVGITAESGLRAAAARGVGWTAVEAWGARTISAVVFVVVSHQLRPRDIGVFALAVVIIEFGQLVVDQGLSRSIVQRKDVESVHLDTAFWAAVGTSLVLAAAVGGGAPAIASALDQPRLSAVVRVLALVFLLAALSSTQMAVLQRNLEFRALAVRQLVSVAAGGVVGVVLALSGAGVWSLVGQSLVQGVVALTVLWRVSPWRPRLRVSRPHLRDMAGFGAASVGIDLVGFFARRGEDLLIGGVLGPVALGFYSVANRVLVILLEVFTTTLNAVAFPVFSRIHEDPERTRRAFHAATRASSAVAFPAFLAVVVLGPEIVAGVFGERWASSGPVLQILAVAGLLRSVTYFNRSLLLASGRASLELGWSVLGAVTKIGAFVVGYRWGITGVAWAVVVHGYVLAPVATWLVNRAVPIHPVRYLRQFVEPLAAGGVMVVVVAAVRAVLSDRLGPLPLVAVAGGIGIAVYAALLWLIAPRLVRELVDHARLVRAAR